MTDPVLDLLRRGDSSLVPAAGPPTPATLVAPPEAPVLSPGGRRGELSGQEWEGFAIGDLLGEGGMGAVYRARQRPLGRVVALKVLAAEACTDPERRRRFADEARAAGLVQHANVVAVHASGEHAGRPWLAMELLPGGSLAEAIARQRAAGAAFSPFAAVDLALQAARGLAAAHAAGLVHRDLKPGNLLLAQDGALKVADFGLARFLDGGGRTLAGAVLGTPAYMSPEQGRGLPALPASDIYSLGCVLYELLTLAPPFDGATPEALALQHNYREPALPRSRNGDVPADLEAVCLKCLQKDPAARFADAAALAADLERLRAGLAPLSALFAPGQLGTGAEEALRRLAGRRRLWPWALAALAAAAAAGGGWWWWDARKAEERAVRERLAPLARSAPAPATAAADLARLARLAGADDPQLRQGRARLAELERLRAGLAALEGRETAPAARAEAAALLDALAQASGGADPLLASWRARLARVEDEIAALRRALAALDRAAAATAALRAEAAPRLDRLAALAGDGDADLARWRGLVAAAAAEQARLQARLARLDDPAPLTAAALDELAAAHRRLGALDPGLQPPPAWAARLAGDRQRLEALGTRLAAALDAPAQDQAATAAAEEAAHELAALQALAAADERRLAERREARRAAAAAREREREALGRRCAVLDRQEPPPADAEAALAAYEALAGVADAAALRWRERLARMRVLERRLTAATDGPPPAGAAADAEALAALCGAGHPQVGSTEARLQAAAAQRRLVAADLAQRPPPRRTPAELDACARLLGADDAQLLELRRRLAAWQAAEQGLAGLDARWVLPPERLAHDEALLAAAAGAAGDDHPQVQAWRSRLAALRGPAAPAWAAGRGHDRHGPWLDLQVDGAVQRLRWLPPGTVTLGSPADEPGRDADEAQVRVRLGRGCWIADSECSQGLWRAVMGSPAGRAGDPLLPVAGVSWDQARDFCARLGARLAGCRARLPTEAEWEAAARAGATDAWTGLAPDQRATAIVHRGAAPAAVAGGPANALGLHHLLGNVREWTGDGYGPLPTGSLVDDPQTPPGTLMAVRGGSWGDPLEACRVANRSALPGSTRSAYLGFRLVVDE